MVPFRTFKGPLFPKPVTGKELCFAVSYSKPALMNLLRGQKKNSLYVRLQKGFSLIVSWQRLTQIKFQGDLESRELDFLRKFACHWIWWLGGKLFDLCFFFMRTIYMSKPVKKCLLIITKSSETTIFPFLQTAWIHRFFFISFLFESATALWFFEVRYDKILTMRLMNLFGL